MDGSVVLAFVAAGPVPATVESALTAAYRPAPSPAAMLVPLVLLAVWVWALVDVSRTGEYEVRSRTKTWWLVVVAVLNVFGVLWWLAEGRPRRR
ncbi:MAG TPA: PLDc N-terminal domain-containing protein [Kineosporiaceae bacterium]|nr:PLDc N-terminal domain-containing protein [Kineosporiaceae bacterium]